MRSVVVFLGITIAGTVGTFLLDRVLGFPSISEIGGFAWFMHHLAVLLTGGAAGGISVSLKR